MDDEGPPEMRNIQYDLSPEKMERIWVGVFCFCFIFSVLWLVIFLIFFVTV